ncbi:DUF3568 domain-containing protein [Shewanella sp. 0m-4]
MKNISILLVLLTNIMLSGCVAVGAVTIGAVTYYKSSKHEVATVNIKATPEQIYQVALKTIQANPLLAIASSSIKNHAIEITKGDLNASLKVSSIAPDLSQLLITSDVDPQPSTQLVLDGVFTVCRSLDAHCVLVADDN